MRTGVHLESVGFTAEEPLILLAVFALGCAAGLIPAVTAYRVDVARTLD
jgi:hypothetical protein